jgi:hypothetical protein
VDRYVLHQRGWNGDRCRCNCNSFRALVARGGISANCSQEPSIGIRPLVAQARRKLALSTGTNWRGPSCYRAASRIALICWTDDFAEAGARDDIGEKRRRSSSADAVLGKIGPRSTRRCGRCRKFCTAVAVALKFEAARAVHRACSQEDPLRLAHGRGDGVGQTRFRHGSLAPLRRGFFVGARVTSALPNLLKVSSN